jgi:hypothetical protein
MALLRRFQACPQIAWAGYLQLLRGGEMSARIARGLAAEGRAEEARRLLARQLDEWRSADAGLPFLAEVREACRALGCRPP